MKFRIAMAALCLVPVLTHGQSLPLTQWTPSEATVPVTVLDDGVVIEGDGQSHSWVTASAGLKPGQTYALRVALDAAGAIGGTALAGTTYYNADFGTASRMDPHRLIVFAPPSALGESPGIRLGQWHTDGSVRFANPSLTAVQPVYSQAGGIALGDGEWIDGDTYAFSGPWGLPPTNASRPLVDGTAYFNTNRWTFTEGAFLEFHHHVQGLAFESAHVVVGMGAHSAGALAVQVREPEGQWIEVGRLTESGRLDVPVPARYLASGTLAVRLATAGSELPQVDPGLGNFVLTDYSVRATLNQSAGSLRGRTDFVEVRDASLPVQVSHVDEPRPFKNSRIELQLDPSLGEVRYDSRIDDRGTLPLAHGTLTTEDGRIEFPLSVTTIGAHTYRLVLESGDRRFEMRMPIQVPALYEAAYGYNITSDHAGTLWWAESGHVIARDCPLLLGHSKPLFVELAGGEAESLQLVLQPTTRWTNLRIAPSDLAGPTGAILPASAISVRQVGYVPIERPTDETGVAASWPDPLFPIDAPLTLAPGVHHPFWLTVTVPRGTPAGVYSGTVSVEHDEGHTDVPVDVRVFGFDLPETPYCTTAFGISPSRINSYHRLESEADKRLVYNKYLDSFARHRVGPYNPTTYDPFTIAWPEIGPGTDLDALTVAIDWTAWDAAMEAAMARGNITSFSVPIPGMGGGNFHHRNRGEINGYKAGTPEYEALFRAAAREIESHLEEKGWLDLAYVYWFDEPDSKDYAFVMEGFERLANAAPKIPRMLTEQPEDPLIGGPTIWCISTPEYDHDPAQARIAAGDTLWWYLCTVPKSPYVTLFIDQPATSLRVWLWQTWQRNITGILVWATDYWDSPSAYPGAQQNPYEDPMSWQRGYGLGKGVKSPWGNGDGRFLYPPRAVFESGSGPVLEGPVESIRWETLRDGIEDYDYFALYTRLVAEAGDDDATALVIPESISKDLVTFTTDPDRMALYRRMVAEGIEHYLSKARND